MTGKTIAAAVAVLLGTLATAPEATAAGLYFTDRGVRPLGRGGAFVAGADDLGAIWYNPAGIVDAPSSLLIDAAYLDYGTTYARQAQTTSATGTTFVQSFPAVHGTTPFLPIPTIAASYRFGDKEQYAFAGGIYAPMTGVTTYPTTITNADGSQSPSPQRYSLISLNGSTLVIIGATFAYKPVEQVRLGVGLQMLTGTFQSTVDFSACPADNLVCASESPNYDSYSRLKVGPIFAPSANVGATYVPAKVIRFGASFQAPFWVSSPATVDVRLPTAVVFDTASQQGDKAHVSFELPPILRVGVEVRPLDADHDLRVELAYVREFWSAEKSINVNPQNIQLLNVTGFPSPFGVSPISIPRGGQDSNSVRLGGEYKFPVGDFKLQLRLGVAYETSGIQNAYVSALTVDSSKVLTSLGAGLYIGERLRLDAMYSHVFASDVTVTAAEAAIQPVNPVKGNPTQTTAVNGGTYSVHGDVIGLGMQYRF